jgi:hypothetical protein
MQQLTKAAKNATIYGQLISLIFQSLEKTKNKRKSKDRTEWNCVWASHSGLKYKKTTTQCGRLSPSSIYRDSRSKKEDRRYTLLLVLVVVVDIKKRYGHKRGDDCHRTKKSTHTHTHTCRAKPSPLGWSFPPFSSERPATDGQWSPRERNKKEKKREKMVVSRSRLSHKLDRLKWFFKCVAKAKRKCC